MAKEYYIWCDESTKKGEFYSNFYGAILIESTHLSNVLLELQAAVQRINITEEIKWGKVDPVKLAAFEELMNVLFNLVAKNQVKLRVMFKQNAKQATGLTENQKENEYYNLYYQFIKHAFGLQYSNKSGEPVYVRIHFDHLPDTTSRANQFKEYIRGLERVKSFSDANIKIRKEDVVEVDSKKHLPLQLLDVVLGAIQFRLNNKHKVLIEGTRRRGKKTIAKEKLYKHIYTKITTLRPRFNIGVSTGLEAQEDKWIHQYRHWSFTPKEHTIDSEKFK